MTKKENSNTTQEATQNADSQDYNLDNDDDKLVLFKKNDLLGGYSLAVRDNWGYKTLRRHITDREKELYEKKFGNKLLTDDEFFEWWCKVNGYIESEGDFYQSSDSKEEEYNYSNDDFN